MNTIRRMMTVAVLVAAPVCGAFAQATDPSQIPIRGEGYNIPWAIRWGYADAVLRDARYGDCVCFPRSPLVPWLYSQEYGPYQGAPWSYRTRLTVGELPDLTSAETPLGRDECHAECGHINACCIDGIGHALYATSYSELYPNWRTLTRDELLDSVEGPTGDSYFVYRGVGCDLDYTHIDEWDLPVEGNILVSPNWRVEHAGIVRRLEDSDAFVDECGNDIAGRCVYDNARGDARSLYREGWVSLCVRSLCGCPATMFWGVEVEQDEGSTRVDWQCAFLKRTWGFAIQWSEDGVDNWVTVGDYVEVEVSDVDHPVGFTWTGTMNPGYVRVIEIEAGTLNWRPSMVEVVG